MEGGPPIFKQDFSCPALLKDQNETLPIRGYHPLWLTFPGHSGYFQIGHWPGPRSLVTTNGVSVDVLSSSYLDISVRWVCLPCGINQYGLGFPIRKSADQSLLTAPHSLSQRVTSFVASLYQGIHQMLFKTLDRTVHESSNRSDNHYYSLKSNLEKILKAQSVSWITLNKVLPYYLGSSSPTISNRLNYLTPKLYRVINIYKTIFYKHW